MPKKIYKKCPECGKIQLWTPHGWFEECKVCKLCLRHINILEVKHVCKPLIVKL